MAARKQLWQGAAYTYYTNIVYISGKRVPTRAVSVGTRRAVSEEQQTQSSDLQRLGYRHGMLCPYAVAVMSCQGHIRRSTPRTQRSRG